MTLKHAFTSAKSDGADATQVQPSNWNADHVIDSGGITIPQNASSPASPAAGNVTIFARNMANRIMPAFVGASGLDTSIQPFLGRNRSVWWQPLGNATTAPITTGIAAATILGTATARNVATTNILTRMKRLGYVSATTASAFAGIHWGAGALQYTIGNGSGLGGFTCVIRFATSDAAAVSGARGFIGISNATATPTNVEPNTLTNSFGMAQLSTDNTQWYMVYGGTAAQTAIALGTALGAPTLTTTCFELALFAPSNVNNAVSYTVTNLGTGFSITGTLTGTAGTALPASTLFLTPRIWRCNNASGVAAGIDISSVYLETDD